MIQRKDDGDGYEACCDNCPHAEDFDADTFQECVDAMKAAGWRISKDKYGAWQHDCPACLKDEIDNLR